jgi:hypothetical protein
MQCAAGCTNHSAARLREWKARLRCLGGTLRTPSAAAQHPLGPLPLT